MPGGVSGLRLPQRDFLRVWADHLTEWACDVEVAEPLALFVGCTLAALGR